mmetsp:Transcript_2227/g.4985  ORF Transcript_2227/g.4985 Transcript_2227/m.4985 type:complete len:205 (-) Transcript_2227:19-633(-)
MVNILFMSVTLLVFQRLRSPLNTEALKNMPAMFVTWAVFQPLRSPLNTDFPKNANDISVMSFVSHNDNWPYGLPQQLPATGSTAKHASMAARKSVLLISAGSGTVVGHTRRAAAASLASSRAFTSFCSVMLSCDVTLRSCAVSSSISRLASSSCVAAGKSTTTTVLETFSRPAALSAATRSGAVTALMVACKLAAAVMSATVIS